MTAIGLSDEYMQVARLEAAGDRSRCECERAILGFTHAELSADALAVWNLPEEIRVAVRYHHSPNLAPTAAGQIALGKVIHAAEGYVNAIGYQLDEGFPPPIDTAIQRLEDLGLGPALAPQLEGFAKEFEAVRALF